MMRLILALACIVFFFVSDTAFAQKSTIAVVNIQQLMTESEAAKHIQGQVQEKREILQKEFLSYETELRDKEKKLVQKKEEMNQEQFLKSRQDFERSLLEKRKEAETKKRELERSIVIAMRKLRSSIAKIVADISDKNGYDLVLSNEDVVIVDKNMDITNLVMNELNKTTSKITVNEE